jgi:hypothetical protein
MTGIRWLGQPMAGPVCQGNCPHESCLMIACPHLFGWVPDWGRSDR